jgi:hypothetical protein
MGLMRIWLCLLIIGVGSCCAWGQGGPPFRTDDPDTPGNKHWEINFGWIGDRNPAAGAYQVPDFDINYGLGDRVQLKYELPIAIEEQRPLPASPAFPQGQEGLVLAGLGESLLGVKIRYYEHHPGDPWFGRNPPSKSSGEPDAEKPVNLSFGTYPQLYLNNPTRSVARGLVASGPNFYLPVEVAGRIGPIRYNADAGYNFGNRSSWGMSLARAPRLISSYMTIRMRIGYRRVAGWGSLRPAFRSSGRRRLGWADGKRSTRLGR